MQIIKFCLRSKSHEIKKLLQIYWEVLDKKDLNSGKLKPEMILVCNHLLNDLKHPNEYIRGSTLRLLCRIDEAEILEQLIPQILQNLEHRHSYVRKNSVLAIISITQQHPNLIPDAAQRIVQFIDNESNNSCKRNALQMLINCDLPASLGVFTKIQDKLSNYPETMQITILELMRKVCRALPVPKSHFVKCAAKLLDSPSNAVAYEAANTLLALTPLDHAVNKALEAYTRLLQTESDQNVKLIVIKRLHSFKVRYERNLRTIIMDILRGLSTPNLDVRRNILSLVLELAASNNINDIITCLKKEIIAINNSISLAVDTDVATQRSSIEYRNLLVRTIHQCAVKFPDVASQVVHLLMNYLGDDSMDGHALSASSAAAAAAATGNKGKAAAHDDAALADDYDDRAKTSSDDVGASDEHKAKSKPATHFVHAHTEEEHKNKPHHSAAYDVILFVKEIVEEYPDLTASILDKLLLSFNDIRNEQVYRVALWILGEYCHNKAMVVRIVDQICESIGELPLVDKKQLTYSLQQTAYKNGDDEDAGVADDKEQDTAASSAAAALPSYTTRTVVLPDGTYAQSTISMAGKMDGEVDAGDASAPRKSYNLRKLIKNGEYFLAAVLSLTLLKLAVKFSSFAKTEPAESDAVELNKLKAKSLLIVTCIIRYGSSAVAKSKLDSDSKDRMLYVIQRLFKEASLSSNEQRVLASECRANFGRMLSTKRREEEAKKQEKQKAEQQNFGVVPFDRMLSIRQLRGLEFSEFDEDDTLNLAKAVGNRALDQGALRTRLSRIHQLTGFSDPIYAEAAVTVHQFDIVLEFLIINNTAATLQNLNLELHTSGDLKIVEKPTKFTLAPQQSQRVEASIKVSSTENGVIFGNIVYDTTGATSDNNIVVMNCIHMDIMDYVHPKHCSDSKFREMWVEFEWENKVPVNTDIVNLAQYIRHIASITNMQLLTPIDRRSNSDQCQFLAANLHAKSIFGEHALMNVSIELKLDDATNVVQPQDSGNTAGKGKWKIAGHIRIRCKSQGIALSLGEKITNGQRSAS